MHRTTNPPRPGTRTQRRLRIGIVAVVTSLALLTAAATSFAAAGGNGKADPPATPNGKAVGLPTQDPAPGTSVIPDPAVVGDGTDGTGTDDGTVADGPVVTAAGVTPTAAAASSTGNGANVSGPYDSTSDGSPSHNGNGGGKATGKPCAGCVGNADNKNPKGQLPGGSDHNHGYECDKNHGIGKGNPAHSGCKPSTNPPSGGGSTDTGGTTTPGTGSGATAGSGSTAPVVTGAVAGESATPTSNPGVVAGALQSAGNAVVSAAQLPFTGLGLVPTAVLGLLLTLAGGATWQVGRRRTARVGS